MRSFITSYLEATESNTPRTCRAFSLLVDRLETEMRRTHGMNASDEGPATGF
jgi:hypothetical protein